MRERNQKECPKTTAKMANALTRSNPMMRSFLIKLFWLKVRFIQGKMSGGGKWRFRSRLFPKKDLTLT